MMEANVRTVYPKITLLDQIGEDWKGRPFFINDDPSAIYIVSKELTIKNVENSDLTTDNAGYEYVIIPVFGDPKKTSSTTLLGSSLVSRVDISTGSRFSPTIQLGTLTNSSIPKIFSLVEDEFHFCYVTITRVVQDGFKDSIICARLVGDGYISAAQLKIGDLYSGKIKIEQNFIEVKPDTIVNPIMDINLDILTLME